MDYKMYMKDDYIGAGEVSLRSVGGTKVPNELQNLNTKYASKKNFVLPKL